MYCGGILKKMDFVFMPRLQGRSLKSVMKLKKDEV